MSGATNAAERLCTAKGIAAYTGDDKMATLLQYEAEYNRYVFEKIPYNISNDKEYCIISEILTGKPSNPTFNMPDGDYLKPLSLTLSCIDETAVIYYTIDGSTPTIKNGIKYSKPITFTKSGTCVIKAIAVVSPYTFTYTGDYYYENYTSDITVGTYTVKDNMAIETPVFTPTSGTYTVKAGGTVRVSISCDTLGTTIYYTVDGSTPSLNSNVYNGCLYLGKGSHTIKAMAYRNGEWSSIVVAKYNIYSNNGEAEA